MLKYNVQLSYKYQSLLAGLKQNKLKTDHKATVYCTTAVDECQRHLSAIIFAYP